MNLNRLEAALKSVCPVLGVNSNRQINFSTEATTEQRAAAQAIADSWDFNTPDVQAEIDAIEGPPNYMNRATREFQLAVARFIAAGQGIDEPTLYATNIGYRKVKDLDTQIAALRAQL